MITHRPLDTITPSLIKQYLYCPVIPWLQVKLCLCEPLSDSMKIAVEKMKPPKGHGQIKVSSKRGVAVIDEILELGEYRVIVERKTYKSYNKSRYVAQVISSYIIAKEKIHKVRKAIIEIEEWRRELDLDEDVVEDIELVMENTRKIINDDKPPRPIDMRKCTTCWYRKFCPFN